MINEVVPDDDVEKRALEIATVIAGNSPDSVVAGLYGESFRKNPGIGR